MEDNVATSSPNKSSVWDQCEEDNDDLLLVNEEVTLNTSSLRTDERYVGFDNNFGDSWIYPSNFPERAYQYNIVQKALFQNTLVVLPTGLGKTFIAAVVMYNIYRWYPMGKVIFMAPTKPLVAQQIDACCKIMGIPETDSIEITGKLSKVKRAQLWQTKRVFFATPQSVQSDIMDGEVNFPFHAIKLVVVDEAHRAKGRYSYTDVVNAIWRNNKFFRILALSATPGRRKDDVEEVIRNLFISCLEVRTEDSVDVVSYVHKRHLKTVVVELGEKLKAIRDELMAIADPHLRNLIDNNLISGRSGSISRNWLVMEQKRFRESLANNRVPQQKELSSDFSICISIYHAIELLERHGTRVFLNNFDETQEGGTKFVVILRPDLRRLVERIREETGPSPFEFSDQPMVNGEIAQIPRNIDFGHPKFEIARDHVLEHFQKHEDAKCIVFCEYRESVMLMHRLLLQHRPLIRPKVFVGQGGTGSIRSVTQRQQIQIMKEFRSGESNALIATSVAEEGIDVGEVDLIVCFDINTSNPTRFIQRIGRTGRKKQGKVLLLATEGKEYAVLKEVLSERNRLNKSISRGGEFTSAFYKQSPRMVPTEFNPKCLKTFIQLNKTEAKVKETHRRENKKKTHNFKEKHRDLRDFFKPKVTINDEEVEVFENENKSPLNSSDKSETNDCFILNEDPSVIDFSPVKISTIDNKVMKKMTKYIKTSSQRKAVDPHKALTSNKLSTNGIKFLVDFSPDLVCDVWGHMTVLWDRGLNEKNLPTKVLSTEQRRAAKSYNKLIDILGNKERLIELMKKQTKNKNNYVNLKEKYTELFKNLKQEDLTNDNFDYLSNKLIELSDLIVLKNNGENSFVQSMVYDAVTENNTLQETVRSEYSQSDYSTDRILDSKYMSQWGDPSHLNESFHQTKTSERRGIEKEDEKNKENYSSDDGVIFVGIEQQSTPLRTCNKFGKSMPKTFEMGQKAARHNENALPDPTKFENESLESENFFDDQFDDIIAANSVILAHIESSNVSRKLSPKKENLMFSEQQNISQELSVQSIDDPAANCLPGLKLDKRERATDQLKENHPELENIDFQNFSEVLSDEFDNSYRTNLQKGIRQNSPDIFEDISQLSKSDFALPKTPSKSIKSACEMSPCINLPKTPSNSPCYTVPKTQSKSTEVSPCLVTKKALTWKEVRLKYIQSDAEKIQPHSKAGENVIELNESDINIPLKNRLKRRIIESDSDTSEENFVTKPDTKGVLPSSSKENRKNSTKKPRLFHKGLSDFFDNEAVHSGSGSEDEIECTQGCYMLDSVVVHDDDVENDQVNMTGVYLQSVRSPCSSSIGKFKIPLQRQYNDFSKILSQNVPEDSFNYKEDSFVTSDEEAEVDRSLCPLERAEEILKNKRRARRKAKRSSNKQMQVLPNRKRVLRIVNESDEDFE